MKLILFTCAFVIMLILFLILFKSFGDNSNQIDFEDRHYQHSRLDTAMDRFGAEYPYPEKTLQLLEKKRIINPILIHADPYLKNGKRSVEPPLRSIPDTAVCAFRYRDIDRISYEIRTFDDESSALASGYILTHKGACGTCSTLRDLAAYLRHRDLTYSVRKCSLLAIKGATLSCLADIGLTPACADTWYYNIQNTRHFCLWKCLWSMMKSERLNKPDGTLNDCIKCDEEVSGPIFKYYAGRTRRNSGITSEIRRGKRELYPIMHTY